MTSTKNDQQIERRPDELWTSYARRTLESLGVNFTKWTCDESTRWGCIAEINPSSEVGVNLYKIPYCVKKAENLETSFRNCSSFGELSGLLNACTDEGVMVYNENYGFNLDCNFRRDGTAVISELDRREDDTEFFPQYWKYGQFLSEKIIRDLADYVLKLKSASGFPLIEKANAKYVFHWSNTRSYKVMLDLSEHIFGLAGLYIENGKRTLVSTDIYDAISVAREGKNRLVYYELGSKKKKAKPIVLVIDCAGYDLQKSKDNYINEIKKPININDVEVITPEDTKRVYELMDIPGEHYTPELGARIKSLWAS
ncbi:hypothetical protein HYX14_01990 [Candidatus Woesearchaeota archaeon]|nr:hypothetical protein [Candidatus Woesearchaeota archaeon]